MDTKNCEYCDKEFEYPNWQDERRFCGYECSNKWKSDEYSNREKPELENKIELDCGYCNKTFQKVPSQISKNNFCSKDCYINYQKEKDYEKQGIGKECKECDKTFYVPPYRKDSARFCSVDCRTTFKSKNKNGIDNHQWNKVKLTCKNCGIIYLEIPSRKHRSSFCSKDCLSIWYSKNKLGEDNPNYKEKSKERLPNGPNWNENRIKAIRRDNKKCQECGISRKEHYEKYNKDLNVDHIKPRRVYYNKYGFIPKEANQLNNLETLCVSCHTEKEFNKENSPMVGR